MVIYARYVQLQCLLQTTHVSSSRSDYPQYPPMRTVMNPINENAFLAPNPFVAEKMRREQERTQHASSPAVPSDGELGTTLFVTLSARLR